MRSDSPRWRCNPPKTVTSRPPETSVYAAGRQIIAVNSDRDEVHCLNKSARVVFELCDGKSREEIADEFAHLYPDVPRLRIDEDVTRVVGELQRKGLVEPESRQRVRLSIGREGP